MPENPEIISFYGIAKLLVMFYIIEVGLTSSFTTYSYKNRTASWYLIIWKTVYLYLSTSPINCTCTYQLYQSTVPVPINCTNQLYLYLTTSPTNCTCTYQLHQSTLLVPINCLNQLYLYISTVSINCSCTYQLYQSTVLVPITSFKKVTPTAPVAKDRPRYFCYMTFSKCPHNYQKIMYQESPSPR